MHRRKIIKTRNKDTGMCYILTAYTNYILKLHINHSMMMRLKFQLLCRTEEF